MARGKFALGCDVGATKVSVSVGVEPGVILDRITDRTYRMRNPKDLVSELRRMIADITEKNNLDISDCMGLGVAFAGFTDSRNGVIVASPNLEGWDNTPLKQILQDTLGVAVRVENDANVGAYGEYRHGGSVAGTDFLYVTLSTGIGGGLIIGGVPYEGDNGVAGEIGHTVVIPDGPKCGCGKQGCLEAVASGLAIERIANERMKRERTSLNDRAAEGKIDARTVFEEARNGDPLSSEIVDTACRYLGLSIANAVMLLSLSSVVIGGGMAREGEYLRRKVEHYMRKGIAGGPNENAKLHISKKPLEVVDIGALQLVFDSSGGKGGKD
ncbi:MAG: ROK family protein [Thermoplasmata archaeon]|uniref:ROK family protein n=1 Tax=Candidatus Sysuiplasma superficiale TaxID=2823368 RepID=A0A8J7YSF0_9ARCH|nr:ROK family protein [Candidatus Sysuiplasma superficiale]MBX8643717.1 ROK family protein [Candidatus Sysuiplasma superficiale]